MTKLDLRILAAGLALSAVTTPQMVLAQGGVPAAPAPGAVQPAPAVLPAYPAPAYGSALPPPMPGAVTGSTAADRDGDGIVDGYYTSDGVYHPYVAPSLPPPQLASRRGERG